MQFGNLGMRLSFPNRGRDETADGQRVIVAWGDSNARGNSTAVGSTPTLGTVKAWDDGSNATYNVTNTDLLEPVAALAIGSQWPRFGITYNALTGKIPVICDVAIGGTRWHSGTSSVSWDTSGTLWPNAITKINRCLNYLGVDKPWAFYINCGVNDMNDAHTITYAHLTYSINLINTNWNFPRIFIVMIGKANEANYSNNVRLYTMNKFIKQLSQDYPNVEVCCSMKDLVAWGSNIQGDDYHLTFAGNELHGTMVARQMALPTSWLKYTRSITGMHYDAISDTRKGYIQTLVSDLGSAIWDYDALHVFSDCAADDRNAQIDWAFQAPSVLVGSPTVAFGGITTNGTSQYLSQGPQSLVFNKSLESDFMKGYFLGTVNSVAGGADRAAGGSRENGSGGITLANQRSTSQLGVLAASTSGTLSSSETKFADNSHYAIFRTGGDHGIIKNGSIVTQATVAAVAIGASALRGDTVFAYNNNTTIQQFLAVTGAGLNYTRRYTTANLSAEHTALSNFLANWLTNVT
jgi:hypothetical protein